MSIYTLHEAQYQHWQSINVYSKSELTGSEWGSPIADLRKPVYTGYITGDAAQRPLNRISRPVKFSYTVSQAPRN